MNSYRTFLVVATMSLAAAPLAAQGRRPAAPANPAAADAMRAAETITDTDIRRRIYLIADDSMLGRATPSPQLELTAQYVASEFRRFGLRPGGDSGTYLQRYPIQRVAIDTVASFAMVMGNGAHGRWTFANAAATVRWASGMPHRLVNGPAVLLVGMPADTALPFGDVPVAGAVVVQVLSATQLNRNVLGPLLAKAKAAQVAGWIIISDRNAQAYAGMIRAQSRPVQILGGMPEDSFPVIEVRDSSALGVLQAAGEDLTALRAGASSIRALNGFTAAVDLRRTVTEELSAPNVIGVLEGSHPQLREEYLFYTAHMDHVGAVGPGRVNVGCGARGADSICNGADDDASGTVTVLELAEAFSQLNSRPSRSVVFMIVSGEERGLWGSEYYSEHPTVPLANTVADINIDMVGRYYNNQPGWTDTIVAIGKEHSDLGATANRIVAEHPELRMNMIDDIWPSENFYFRSDHYNFARKGVPILFFFNGTHPDYHRPSDEPALIDAEKMMRIGRTVFYLGLDIANAATRPQWNPDSRRRIVEGAGR